MDAPPVQYTRTTDGFDIAYTVAGQGPDMLMVPYPFSHATYSWTVPGLCDANLSLARKFRLVHFDMRGQGLSTRRLLDTHRIEDYLMDLDAVVQALSLEKFVLFSPARWKAAVVYASKHPENVEAFILLDPLGNVAASDEAHGLAVQAAANWDSFLMMMGSTFNPAPTDTLARLSLRDRLKECFDLDDYLKMLKAQQSFDARDWLSNLKVPSLIVQPHSPWSVSSATEIAAAIPGARLQRVEELGNMLHASEDEPSPGVAAIVEFVAGLPGAAIEVPEQPNGTPAQHEGLDTLSPRQREVLRLIGQGKTNREIAGDLVISARTVERHLADIYAKTGVRNRAQAAVFAKEIDLV